MIHLIVLLITGLIAGAVADNFMGRRHGWLVAMIIGLIGGGIGWFLVRHLHLAAALHLPATGLLGWVVDIVVAVIGAAILLFVLGLFRRKT